MSSFIRTFEGNIFNIERIGGVKAVDSGFLLFGTAADEILEYSEVPVDVAVVWRDATADMLSSHRPKRQPKQIDWLSLAATVDRQWAVENGWTPSAAIETELSVAPMTDVTPRRIVPPVKDAAA